MMVKVEICGDLLPTPEIIKVPYFQYCNISKICLELEILLNVNST